MYKIEGFWAGDETPSMAIWGLDHKSAGLAALHWLDRQCNTNAYLRVTTPQGEEIATVGGYSSYIRWSVPDQPVGYYTLHGLVREIFPGLPERQLPDPGK